MVTCDTCGVEIKRPIIHMETNQKLCLKCVTENAFFTLPENDLISPDERRTNIRIPLTITLQCSLPGQEGKKTKVHAISIDLCLSGICFAWECCKTCHGYEENKVHKECILYPYYVSNPDRVPLSLDLRISDSLTIVVDAYIAYVEKDGLDGAEYVGAQFKDVNINNKLILEKMLITQGKS